MNLQRMVAVRLSADAKIHQQAASKQASETASKHTSKMSMHRHRRMGKVYCLAPVPHSPSLHHEAKVNSLTPSPTNCKAQMKPDSSISEPPAARVDESKTQQSQAVASDESRTQLLPALHDT